MAQARAAHKRGDAREAADALRRILDYPGKLNMLLEWRATLNLFADVATALVNKEFGARVRAVAGRPNDPKLLYALGYDLIEVGLPGAAATVLARAHRLVPTSEEILMELCSALESAGNNAEAVRLLRAAPALLNSSFMCQYLLAFNALMTGDLAVPRQLLPRLQGGTDATQVQLASRIERFLARASALAGHSALDRQDLRGWHYVLTGGVLLHVSPHGFDEGMNGRYAFVQDSYQLVREAITRLQVVLEAWQMVPRCVFELPDRDSAILAHATASVLGVPVTPWPEQGSSEPGLIAAYDLNKLEGPLLATFYRHVPGQLVWGHASCWTTDQPFAADLTTFLYQLNTEPWGAQLGGTADDPTLRRLPASTAPVAELAAQIVAAELEADALVDLDGLRKLARVAAVKTTGAREIVPTGSPVPSNRFA